MGAFTGAKSQDVAALPQTLLLLSSTDQRGQLLKHTKHDIVDSLSVWPKTQHDLSSFLVDMWYQTVSICFLPWTGPESQSPKTSPLYAFEEGISCKDSILFTNKVAWDLLSPSLAALLKLLQTPSSRPQRFSCEDIGERSLPSGHTMEDNATGMGKRMQYAFHEVFKMDIYG
ncbi:hypothetical protein P7K49_038857 [Saguinus oedipus]|uniref:Nuclear transport factor 2 domain-containing protein n=1 Tax=Saguinus oedipus TaxID=9490 RepID=A0ABQ9TFV6_SAGOE|nr:hypothetical protein P7K49_038857 [Saguinus oedipus]